MKDITPKERAWALALMMKIRTFVRTDDQAEAQAIAEELIDTVVQFVKDG